MVNIISRSPGANAFRRMVLFAIAAIILTMSGFACTARGDDSSRYATLALLGNLQNEFRVGMFGVQSEGTRESLNKERVSCYADMADKAYDSISSLSTACPTNGTEVDTRNGMGQWTLQSQQSTSNGDIIKFWERTSGNRKEIAIGMRGSVTAGDWYRDAQSQFWDSRPPQDNAISNLGSAPNIDIVGSDPKLDAGFDTRVNNLAPEIAQKLQELETWRSGAAGREIGVKVAGHSLGAATATIAGLYIADRYEGDNKADVEVFAYNSPKPVNKDMSDTYRKAATSCNFNVHVFNNSQDVVSALPVGAHHVIDEANGPAQFGRESCAYRGLYRQSTGWAGMHVPSALTPLAAATQALGNYVLANHDQHQWILSTPWTRIDHAPTQIAASWFPVDDMGGSVTNITIPPTRTPVSGIFDFNLYNATHGKYMRAGMSGTRDVRFDRTTAGTDELFRMTPGNGDCVRHGGSVTIRPVANFQYYLKGDAGNLTNDSWLHALHYNTFTVINHTEKFGCIAQNDVISLRTWDGQYVVAEASGYANANSSDIGPWEKFTVQNVQNITPIPQPGTEGWQHMSTGSSLVQISVGFEGEVWGVNSSDYIYRYDGENDWDGISGRLKHVAVGRNGVVWGVNSSDEVYRYNGGSSWTEITTPSGGMKQVSVGHDGAVYGVQWNDDIWKYDGSNSWTKMPNGAKLRYISVRTENELWGVNSANQIWRHDGTSWTSIPAPQFSLPWQISVGMGGEVYLRTMNSLIYRYDDPGWTLVPGLTNVRHVSVGFYEEVWAVTFSDDIYRLRNY